MRIVNVLIYLVFGISVLITITLENKKIGVTDLVTMFQLLFQQAGMINSPKNETF
jgi:hypothetical protein